MKPWKMTAVVVLGTVVAAGALWAGQRWFGNEGTSRMAVLRLSKGRSIEIRSAPSGEMSRAVYYKIPGTQRFQVIGFTHHATSNLQFETLRSGDGRLVAVVERSSPNVVLILHDYSTRSSWPHTYCSETFKEARIRGRTMLRRLQAHHPNRTLILSEDAFETVDLRVQ